MNHDFLEYFPEYPMRDVMEADLSRNSFQQDFLNVVSRTH